MADPEPISGGHQRPQFIAMFFLLAALYACGQIHRSSGAVISPVLNRELGLDARELGVIMAGLFLAAGVTQIPFGILLDRFGARRSVTLLMLVGIIGTTLFPLANDWPLLLAARLLIGVGFSGVFMSSIVIFSAWTPREQMTTWAARITAVGGCGGLIATTPLAAAIELTGWRTTYSLLAAATAALVLASFFFIRDRPPSLAPPMQTGGETLRECFKGLLRVLREPAIRPMLIVSPFMYTPMQVTVGLWAGPYLLEVHGLDAVTRGNVLFAMMAVHLIAALGVSPLERLLGSRKWIVVIGAALQAIQFLILALAGPSSLSLSILLLLGIACVGPMYVMVMVHCQSSFPHELTGRVISLVTSVSVFGIFLNQTVTSFIVHSLANPGSIGSTAAFSAVFGLMSILFVLVGAIYMMTRETRI